MAFVRGLRGGCAAGVGTGHGTVSHCGKILGITGA